jgi:hypothetical protein
MIVTVTTLILAALAVARLTRFVTDDRIFLAPRAWLLRRLDENGLAAYFVTCPWCVSVWAGAVVAPAAVLAGDSPWFVIPAAALAFSYVAGLLAGKAGE